MTNTHVSRSTRAVTWLGFLLGTLVSISGNVMHAAMDTWTPAELIGAGFWPAALLIALEVLTRVPWPDGKRWAWARWGGLGMVAAVSAVLSYLHLRSLMLHWGEGAAQATIGPLAVDGLMLICATALLAISPTRITSSEPAPRPVLVYGSPIGPEPAPVAPVHHPLPEPTDTYSWPDPVSPAQLSTPVGDAALASILDQLETPQPTTTAPLNGHSRPVKATTSTRKPRRTAATPADGKSKTEAWFKAEAAAGRMPTGPEIADRAGVNRRTGTRWLNEWSETNV